MNQWRLRGAASADDAQSFLSANYLDQECSRIAERLVCSVRKRSITICTECEQNLQDDRTVAAPGECVAFVRLCGGPCVHMSLHAGP